MLVGDSAGMVSPFNGEGIDYALESARIAADVIVTHHRMPQQRWRDALQEYPEIVRDRFGGYVTLGRVFADLIGRYGCRRPHDLRGEADGQHPSRGG